MRLRRGEQAALAGHVVKRRDPLIHDAREHLEHLAGVCLGIQIGWDHVRPEKRDHETHRGERAALVEQFELPQFAGFQSGRSRT